MSGEIIYSDTAELSEVVLYKKKLLISKSAKIELAFDRITLRFGEEVLDFPFDSTSAVTVLGKNKLNVYFGDKVYQLKGSERFCALKYVNLYYRYKNVMKGDENDTFLGL
jgi:hypothetical protein